MPGQTLLIRMFSGASSVASVLANPMTPVRAILDNISPSTGCLTDTEVRFMIRPPPRVRMLGTTARVKLMVLIRFKFTAS